MQKLLSPRLRLYAKLFGLVSDRKLAARLGHSVDFHCATRKDAMKRPPRPIARNCAVVCLFTFALFTTGVAVQPGSSARRAAAPLPSPKSVGPNLIPATSSGTPDYWCTWGSQNYAVDSATAKNAFDHGRLADTLTDARVFGPNGWANAFNGAQRDLFILFDVGWDVEPGTQFDKARWKLGSQIVSSAKFPKCVGTPVERLRELNALAVKAGWKGAGIWVPAQGFQDGRDRMLLSNSDLESSLRERLRWSQQAGIHYWKVDYGGRNNASFRRLLSKLAAEEAPDVWVEHSRGTCPLNDVRCPYEETLAAHESGEFRNWGDGQVVRESAEIARFSQVFRTYDVTLWFSIPSTLDRAGAILESTQAYSSANGILNCEDEPYIAASLGLSMGIMRNPHWLGIQTIGADYDPRELRHRSDEVVRAAHWHRIAPAFSIGGTPILLDQNRLKDVWRFRRGDTWANWVTGQTITQSAPARTARGLKLPEVTGAEVPYVTAARNPNGAISIATFPRLDVSRRFYFPLADVTLAVPDLDHPIGVFGRYRSLTLRAPAPISGLIVYAQDLKALRSVDITSQLSEKGFNIVIPGSVIDRIGTSAASPGDRSDPGLVLRIYNSKVGSGVSGH